MALFCVQGCLLGEFKCHRLPTLTFYLWETLMILLLVHERFYPCRPEHQHVYSPFCSLHISYGTDKENYAKKSKAFQVCNHFYNSHEPDV